MNKRFLPFCILLVTISCPIYGVSTGADFLKLSVGARQTGMGESCVAACPDASAAYWNPAGLAQITSREINFMHSEAITDATLTFVGLSYPIPRYGTVSISSIFYSIDPIPVTLSNGSVLGDLTWNDTAIILSYAHAYRKNLLLGTGIKYIHRKESDPIFGTSTGKAWAFDMGIMYTSVIPHLDAGLSIVNTGSTIRMSGETKKDVLPQTARIGISYTYPLDRAASILVTSDLHKVLSEPWYPGIGLELNLQRLISLRAGYYQKTGAISGITYGLGFRINKLQVDYSNIPVSELVGHTRNNKVSFIVYF